MENRLCFCFSFFIWFFYSDKSGKEITPLFERVNYYLDMNTTVNEDPNNKIVRTRYAPSPTGSMHVGNLRTALYEYLIAKSKGGSFVLRIEDTDRERFVENSLDIIYDTLRLSGLQHDEGPDVGGEYGPYVQSERLSSYKQYVEELLCEKKAYRCFCTKERLASLKSEESQFSGYDRHCRNLDETEIEKRINAGESYVIRQKMPTDGETIFEDLVYGKITVPNEELDDQILLKADGFPTYNFANVIDDHAMAITHVVRGSEYLSSTPKYNLLYEAFGWDIPTYIHLPLIQGKGEDGTISKLSKRHGATSFSDLLEDGYLPEAIMNYIALLGWAPKDETREIFSLSELTDSFHISGISKSPSIFDYAKLEWFNGEYIRKMSSEEFLEKAKSSFDELVQGNSSLYPFLTEILQPRITKFQQIKEKLAFLVKMPEFDLELFSHKKSKTDKPSSYKTLCICLEKLESVEIWDKENIHELLVQIAQENEVKNAFIMWPLRIAVTGTAVTPGGAVEALILLGKNESLARIQQNLDRLSKEL